MKKNRVFGKFHSWGHCFYFPKILVLLCVVQLKEKKMISENWKIQYIHMVQPSGQVHQGSLKIKIYMIYF